MTLITFDNGGPVFKDGKIGTGQGCCCDGDGGLGYSECGCPVAVLTFNVTFTVPDPHPNNDPSPNVSVQGGVYNAEIVIEYGDNSPDLVNACFWLKCVQVGYHGIYVGLFNPGGRAYPYVQFGFAPSGCDLSHFEYVFTSPVDGGVPGGGVFDNAPAQTDDDGIDIFTGTPCAWPTTTITGTADAVVGTVVTLTCDYEITVA